MADIRSVRYNIMPMENTEQITQNGQQTLKDPKEKVTEFLSFEIQEKIADKPLHIRGTALTAGISRNLNMYMPEELATFADKLVNSQQYPVLNLWLSREDSFNGNVTVTLFDSAGLRAINELSIGAEKWFQMQIRGGSANADLWQTEAGFNWTQVWKVSVACWFDEQGTGAFWVDGLFFGGCRYGAVVQDLASQGLCGLREQVEVNEELWSDAECLCRAQALLSNLKDPTECLTLRSSVLDFGSAPVLAGDCVHVVLPVEDVDADFRVLSAEYRVVAASQTLETTLELGREAPLLADYVYALKSRTDSLCRYKAPRRN